MENIMEKLYAGIMNQSNNVSDQEVSAGLLSADISFVPNHSSDKPAFKTNRKSEESVAAALNSDFETFKSNLAHIVVDAKASDAGNLSLGLTEAQIAAGYFGQRACLTAGSNEGSFYANGNMSLNMPSDAKVNAGNLSLSDSLGTEFDLNEFGAGNLAFSTEENMKASQFSTYINIALAKQEDFVERFFPTIVIDPKETGIRATVKLASFTNEWTRDIDDDRRVAEKMDKKSIIKNIYNNDILGEDRTAVIPVVRPQYSKYLVDKFKFTTGITGETVTTAPYVFGEKFDILRMSQTDKELAKGKQDYTDSLLPTITLSDVYVGMTIGGEDLNFKLDVSAQPGSNFGYIGTGHFKGLQINFEERPVTIQFDPEWKQVNGIDIPAQVGTAIEQVFNQNSVTGDWKSYKFTFLLTISGNANIETGEVALYGNKIVLSHITDDTGTNLDLTSGFGKALKDAITNCKFVGYNLKAYRSNTNLRTKGRMVRIDEYSTYLVAPWRGPFQVTGPITRHTGDECDYDHVGSLITCITAASDVHGILTLERYADSLRLRKNNPKAISHDFDYGINDNLVDVYYSDKVLNVTDHVDSIMSHQRMIDTQTALLNELRLSCLNMLIDSNYLLAYNVLYRQSGQKPIILIGTDPVIKEFLLYGNSTNVIEGVNFDIVVDSILNPRVKGKMYVTLTLGKNIGDLNGIQALNFGYRLHSIAVTATINPDTNGNKAMARTIVIPRYNHVPLLPIMMVYQVSGLPEVIKKIPVLTK